MTKRTSIKSLSPELGKLASILINAGREGLTASEIVTATGCSKPTVYARLDRLVAKGWPVNSLENGRRTGPRGPRATAWYLGNVGPKQEQEAPAAKPAKAKPAKAKPAKAKPAKAKPAKAKPAKAKRAKKAKPAKAKRAAKKVAA